MTRAKERLYLTRARRRFMYGNIRANPASRFLRDLPDDSVVAPLGSSRRGDTLTSSGLRAAADARRGEVDDSEPMFSPGDRARPNTSGIGRPEGHTSKLQSLLRISYAVCCAKKTNTIKHANIECRL